VVLIDSSAETKSTSSTVEVYQASSATPHRVHSLPFRLRNVVWSVAGATVDPTAFTLVGITQAWAVVALGDHVHVPQEEGTSARNIGTLGVASSRTIFADIFGQSAFVDVHAPAETSWSAAPSADTHTHAPTGFFEARAYLMPPLESMFDALMDSFLKPRIAEMPIHEEDAEELQDDEDVDMAVVEETEAFSDPRQHRVIDEREMDQFVALFRRHAVEGQLFFLDLRSGI
jgi:NET1-associated nuclear protein 1 (U3 small nucleolar RNA-associated protein 17)